MVKNPAANAGDIRVVSLIPGWEDALKKGMATHSLQYSCIENPMDRETWWVTVHGVAKRQTKLKQHHGL